MSIQKLLPIVVVALALSGCGRSGGAGAGTIPTDPVTETGQQFSVNSPVSANDLAFLFPISASGRPQPFVTLQSEPSIPGSRNFQRIVSEASQQGVFFNDVLSDPGNWTMVSFRYTPCEFFAGQDNPCKEQLRFVYQPMDLIGGRGFLDFSLHVTYEFNEYDEVRPSDLMAAIYKLRSAAAGKTDNEPLSVHPVLVDRSDRVNYFNEIQETIWKPFVFDRNPKAITFMGLSSDGMGSANIGEWRFLFGRISQTGDWVLQSLPDGSGLNVEVLTVDDANQGNLFSNINENTGFNILTGGRVSESAAAAALVPQVSNEHNVNCASCHTVDNQVIRNNTLHRGRINIDNFDNELFISNIIANIGDDIGFNNNLISNQFKGGMFSVADGTPFDGSPPTPEDEVVTRMFGYMHAEPVISQRMAFDNGMAVNRMNKAIGMDQVQEESSTRSCTTFSQRFEVMACLFEGNLRTSLSQCIQQSCR